MNTAFTSVIAYLDTPSRDNQVLAATGSWTLLAPGPIIHASSGTIVGELLELRIPGDDPATLVVSGMASPSIAEVLNDGSFKLAVGMDELILLSVDPYAGVYNLMAGRVRGAHLVKAADWMWAL